MWSTKPTEPQVPPQKTTDQDELAWQKAVHRNKSRLIQPPVTMTNHNPFSSDGCQHICEKWRPDHWLLLFKGRQDSTDLFPALPLISSMQLNCPPSDFPPERQAVSLQSWDGRGKSCSLPFGAYLGTNTWLTHSSNQSVRTKAIPKIATAVR